MHLVFLNQYYPPDAAPTGVMLADLVDGLLRDGHEVSVLCAAGGYAGPPADARAADRRLPMEAPPSAQPAPASPVPRLHIHRIGATKFGRGTFLGKVLDYASYFLGAAWKLLTLRPAPQRIVALTTPPYLSVLARLVSKLRAADHAHWVMDLYPDVLAAHEMLGERHLAYRLLGTLARWGFGGQRCAAVLTLGPDMAERVKERMVAGGDAEPRQGEQARPTTASQPPTVVSWVPLWGAEETIEDGGSGTDARALRWARGWSDADLVVMYSGNMGLGHRFGEILAAARELPGGRDASARAQSPHRQAEAGPGEGAQAHRLGGPPSQPLQRLRLVFFGGGKRRDEVAAFARSHPDAAVELFDYAPAAHLAAHLRSADVHLASLDPAWTGTMVPSKVQGIFAAARPVIFVGNAESSIGRWVVESGGGWVVAAGDTPGLLAALAEAREPATRAARGHAAKAFAEEHFDRRRNVARVVDVLTRRRGIHVTRPA